MTDIIDFASQYEMRGNFADFSDIIRDTLAQRSNNILHSKTNLGVLSSKALAMYDDWEEIEDSSWPSHVKKRCGMPHVFHKIIGKWVRTLPQFQFAPDIANWILNNSTNSVSDRELYLRDWCNLHRLIRINNPYSHYEKPIPSVYKPGSILVRNLSTHISDADLMMAFSVFGHIVDFHHPFHNKTSKKCFYVFIEFYNVDLIPDDIEGVLYFNNHPIIVERVKSQRKTPEYMSSKSKNNKKIIESS